MSITITPGLPVRIGFAWLIGCHNSLPNEACAALLNEAAAQAKQKFDGRQLSEDPNIQ